MSNVLSEHKKQQVLALGRLGWPLRQIERQTGVRREAAAGYLRAAGIPLRPPRGWGRQSPTTAANETPPDPQASAKPANGVTPDLTAGSKPANEVTPDSEPPSADLPELHPAGRRPSTSACEPYRELIELALARGRNAKAIWQDLVDDHSISGDYQSVKRFVRKRRGSPSPAARAVILTAPGEEAQVDHGTGPMVRDPLSGKHRRTRLFVLTLGYSRKCVRLLSFRSSTRLWAELHEKAFVQPQQRRQLLVERRCGHHGAAMASVKTKPQTWRLLPLASISPRYPQSTWACFPAGVSKRLTATVRAASRSGCR